MSIVRNRQYNYIDPTICQLKKIAITSDIYYKHAAALIHNKTTISLGINKFIGKIN